MEGHFCPQIGKFKCLSNNKTHRGPMVWFDFINQKVMSLNFAKCIIGQGVLFPLLHSNQAKWFIQTAWSRYSRSEYNCDKTHNHRLIKTQIGHARDFTWYRGQRPSPARVILSHERVQIHARENLCSYAINLPHVRVRELLLCDI